MDSEVDIEKDVVAFLNYKEGGYIYIGIDKDGSTVGVNDVDDVDDCILRLKDRIKHNRLVSEYTTIEGDKLVMTSDKTFASPSTAADFCIGSSNNGWLVWKDKDGNTLESVYRTQLE